MRLIYLTHPEVRVDAGIPVPQWTLSAAGAERAEALAKRGVLPHRAPLIASGETKAVALAEIIARHNHGLVHTDAALNENDRSATGYLPPGQFEALADRFFAEPGQSAEGWERAVDAQERVVRAVAEALDRVREPAVFCGHGGVGTLLKCHVAGRPISRDEDQGRRGHPGGGNVFIFDFEARRLIADWMAFEDFAG